MPSKNGQVFLLKDDNDGKYKKEQDFKTYYTDVNDDYKLIIYIVFVAQVIEVIFNLFALLFKANKGILAKFKQI